MDAHWCYNISKELNYKVVYYVCVYEACNRIRPAVRKAYFMYFNQLANTFHY